MSCVLSMPLREYFTWQEYDSVEPLSVTMALDRLFARMMYLTARANGDKKSFVEHWLTFEPTERIIKRKSLQQFKDAVKTMKEMNRRKKKKDG